MTPKSVADPWHTHNHTEMHTVFRWCYRTRNTGALRNKRRVTEWLWKKTDDCKPLVAHFVLSCTHPPWLLICEVGRLLVILHQLFIGQAEKWRGEFNFRTKSESAALLSAMWLWSAANVCHKARLYRWLDTCRHICVEEEEESVVIPELIKQASKQSGEETHSQHAFSTPKNNVSVTEMHSIY